MRRSRILLLAAALLAPLAPAAAPAQERYGESVDVEVVNVDVYVTDPQGNPVTGLTRDDFVLLEGRKRLAIDYFYASEGAAPGEPPAALRAPVAEGSRTSAVRRQPPHVVVYVDNANISPAGRNRVLGRLRGFVDRALAEGARMMVVTDDGSPNVRLPFTDDRPAIEQLEGLAIRGFGRLAERRSILAAIEQLDQSIFQISADEKAQQGAQMGSLSARPGMLESELDAVVGQIRMYAEAEHNGIVNTIRSLAGLVDLLGELPGRKAIVHVSDGLAVRPGQEMIYALEDSYQGGSRLTRVASTGPDGEQVRSFSDRSVSGIRALGSEIAAYDATPEYKEMVARANASRVTFYTISAGGAGMPLMDAEISGGEAAVFSNSAAGFQAVASSSDQEGIRLIADATGGRSLSGAGVEEFLDRLVADMTSYYSLGFVPADPDDAGYHRLEVKLARKGLTVRHREGYGRRPGGGVGRRTVAALLLGFDDNRHGLDLQVVRQEHLDDETLVHVMLEVPIEALALLPRDGLHAAAGTVYVISRPHGGEPTPLRRFPFSIEIPDEQLDEAMAGRWGIPMVLRLAAGPHDLAVALSEDASGARSIVRTAVQVRQWGDPFGP